MPKINIFKMKMGKEKRHTRSTEVQRNRKHETIFARATVSFFLVLLSEIRWLCNVHGCNRQNTTENESVPAKMAMTVRIGFKFCYLFKLKLCSV